jgi:hypothetical protein
MILSQIYTKTEGRLNNYRFMECGVVGSFRPFRQFVSSFVTTKHNGAEKLTGDTPTWEGNVMQSYNLGAYRVANHGSMQSVKIVVRRQP